MSPGLYAVYKNTVRHILRYEVFVTLNTLSNEPMALMATDYQGVVDAVTQSSTAEVKQQLARLNQVATDRAKLFWSHYNESTG